MGWIGVLMVTLGTSARAEEPRLAEYFGFLPLEIYKLDTRISNLLIDDLDGDKVEDIVVVNNARSRIDLLLSTPRSGDEPAEARPEANQVPSSQRMRRKSLPVNKEVVSLAAGDFNGDGRTDLAYYGTPAELIVLFNDGSAQFGRPKRFPVGEAVESPVALAVGDLNRDGRADLALLAPSEIVMILQGDQGLGEPEHLPHACGNPRILKAVDLDGDGGDDLVILDGGHDDPVRVRFATEGGKLGPEQRFSVETPRAIACGEVDGKKGVELLTIEAQSGRAKVLGLVDSDEEQAPQRGRLIFYPLPRGDERGRSLAVGDLDGDGRADVVATDPANAQFLVYCQGKTGLGAGQSFPGLVGGKAVQVADLDGDGKGEVIVLSESEKQIARSVLEGERLSFPAPLPIRGEPVALEVADLDGDKAPEILYVTKGQDEGSETFLLRGLKREKSGAFLPFRWGQDETVPVKSLSGAPAAVRVLDVNADGLADILLFSYGPPVLLLGRPDGKSPAPASGRLGQLAANAASISTRTPDGSGLLVAQNTYARSLLLDQDGQWRIRDQYNAGRGSAQVIGAAAIDTNGDGTPEIALLDKTSRSLLFLDRKDGVYRLGGSLPVGPLNFQGLHVADLDGDGKDDLLLAGTDKFGVVLTGRKGQRLKTLASYESPRKEAQLADLIPGDLNADGQPDIALIDTAEHFVEIVTYDSQSSELDRALSFKVFEKKSFRHRDNMVEPRDLAIGDVDGDGRQDLVLIVHDRVLVYRQDPGPERPTTSKR
ncbi:MAG: VCBS repeat-containing protein [Isosphaeraceae bacterium]|nr:VCBS repeat-containing protein [Isosphaeraceae bacterium]